MCANPGSTAYSLSSAPSNIWDRAIEKIANRTRNLKNEQYRILAENGDVVLQKQGKEHEVATTAGEKREYLQNAVSIHNHPSGGTFFSDDLRDFGYGAKQIVAASPEGTYKLTHTGDSGKWYDMQQALNDAVVSKAKDYLDLKKAAEQTPKVKRLAKQGSAVAKQGVDARQAGQSKEQLDKLSAKYKKIDEEYKSTLKQEIRNAEVKPMHDWYRKNAKKYGFIYTFIPKK